MDIYRGLFNGSNGDFYGPIGGDFGALLWGFFNGLNCVFDGPLGSDFIG